MVARSGTFPGAGNQGSAAQVPWGWLGYAEATANQGAITGEVDVTNLTTTVTVGTSRRVKITFSLFVSSTVADDSVFIKIKEGATILQQRSIVVSSAGVSEEITPAVVLTPTPGVHTYKVTIGRDTGTGTITNAASANTPSFVLVEDIGPSA